MIIKIIGLILCGIGGGIIGRNAKNYWVILGITLAQIGIVLMVLK